MTAWIAGRISESMTDSIQVMVRCFAGLKEKIGKPEFSLVLPSGCSCAAFKEQLVASWPEAAVYSSRLLVARNGSYLNDSDLIHDRDELACFPPVSGG